MLRIIGGEFKSRRLKAPEGADITRPMSGLAKEAIFNLLRGWFEDANVLDLFAGVGTMGLEAVSRGAKRVLMVEQNKRIFGLLRQNIASLGCGDRAEAMMGDAFSPTVFVRAPRPTDVAFVDPPYRLMQGAEERDRVLKKVASLREMMAEKGFVVLRTPRLRADADLSIDGFEGPETHEYGRDMRVHLYVPRGGDLHPDES